MNLIQNILIHTRQYVNAVLSLLVMMMLSSRLLRSQCDINWRSTKQMCSLGNAAAWDDEFVMIRKDFVVLQFN